MGAVVFWARPREAPNLFFGAFMALIGAGVILGVVSLDLGPGGAQPLVQRLFWIAYVFDPLALLYLASIFPARNAFHRPAVLVPFAAAGLALLARDLASPFSKEWPWWTI